MKLQLTISMSQKELKSLATTYDSSSKSVERLLVEFGWEAMTNLSGWDKIKLWSGLETTRKKTINEKGLVGFAEMKLGKGLVITANYELLEEAGIEILRAWEDSFQIALPAATSLVAAGKAFQAITDVRFERVNEVIKKLH